jgi:hypothetical protein
MNEWLYKARDRARSGDLRPSYEATRSFIVDDGLLARSARTRSDKQAWISNVRNVLEGDVIHVFYKQHVRPRVRFIGSFRVRDPGDARFDPSCALAVVKDPLLEERLREAYATPRSVPMTGWLVEPTSDVRTPAAKEPGVAKFLQENPTLVRYHEDRLVSTVTAQLPLLPAPLRLLHGPLLVTIETWSYGVTVARLPAAALIGEGEDDRSALEALAENILEFVEGHLPHAQAGRLGGALAKQWASLTAMVDVSAVPVAAENAREVA